MLKKVYWIVAFILSAMCAIDMRSLEELKTGMLIALGIYIGVKLNVKILKPYVKKEGGVLKWMFPDTTKSDPIVTGWNFSGSPNPSRDAEKRAADQAVYNRTKAKNEAMYHQYYANLNRGTYSGYQSQNRANAAWERSKR